MVQTTKHQFLISCVQEACALTGRCFARAQERSASKDTAARVAANVLIRVALDKGSSDNVTVVVLDLRVPK